MITTDNVLDLILLKANEDFPTTDNDIMNLERKVCIDLETDRAMSINTWKRLYGMLKRNDGHKFSARTLKVIASYLGCDSWKELEENIDKVRRDLTIADKNNSVFVRNGNTELKIRCMRKHDILRVYYSPKRVIELEYLGSNSYRVMNSHNSKLKNNDVFTAYEFTRGDSFRAYGVRRDDQYLGNYMSALNHRIEHVEVRHAPTIDTIL